MKKNKEVQNLYNYLHIQDSNISLTKSTHKEQFAYLKSPSSSAEYHKRYLAFTGSYLIAVRTVNFITRIFISVEYGEIIAF